MGDRGYNAGGFAYMQTITCPRCGARRKLGHQKIRDGHLACGNRRKCNERKRQGHLLYRVLPDAATDARG